MVPMKRCLLPCLILLVASRDASIETPTLRSLARARHFVMGSAVNVTALQADAAYRGQLAAQYNGVTSEWAMKFGPIHPARDRYDFTAADQLVRFAEANSMVVHGHALVWEQAVPDWVSAGPHAQRRLLELLRDHIATVVGRYRGRIATWDVVNEVVDGYPAALRRTLWLEGIGPAYIDSAFVWAHRADPAARLYLNETHAEVPNPKSDSLLSLVQELRRRGIPIDGVGFQAHFTLAQPPDPAALRANLARFAAAGFDVRVSEMDVRLENGADSTALAQQGALYGAMLDACLQLGTRCTAFTSWGFSDRYSWIPKFYPGFGRGLPFDTAYRPKPALSALVTRLQHP